MLITEKQWPAEKKHNLLHRGKHCT